MQDGWIKLHRKIRENEMWQKEPFDKRSAWIDLLLRATHKEYTILIKGIDIKLKPGQFFVTKKGLAKNWSWSRTKVANFLNILEGKNRNHTNQMLTTSEPLSKKGALKKTHLGIVITITNWKLYQSSNSNKDTKENIKKTSKRHQEDTYKNVKNIKEIKHIVEYFNSTLKKSYWSTAKSTQSLIRKRLEEGRTIEDFELVIKNRKDRWENSKNMDQYLTPDTLFAEKNFEKYLQDAKSQNKNEVIA